MKKSFASFSFGCRVNQAEMEEIGIRLSEFGYRHDANNPSIYIINTCSVTAKAEREARQYINQIRRKFPKTRIIITGCAATRWISDGKQIQGVDLMIDNQEKEYIAALINTHNDSNAIKTPRGGPERSRRNSPGVEELVKTDKYLSCGRMILKIQDGCQRFCSYCIVPYLRGKPKSVPISQIIKIINERTEAPKTPQGGPERSRRNSPDLPAGEAGVEESEKIKEVILTAINTEAYGLDTGETFNDLIRTILNKTKIERLSFGSIHPWSINSEFIQQYKQFAINNRFIDFFHIPLQSGSNKILNLMKRGYTREDMAEKLNALNKINPLAFIGTDVIVGFLDESDCDFQDTYNFLSSSPISKVHIFRYSIREKTAAFYMAKRLNEPSPQKKLARAKLLSDLGRKKYQQFLSRHLNKTFPALFLSRDKDNLQWALLSNQIPVIINTDKNLTGEIKTVKVNRLLHSHLQGVPL